MRMYPIALFILIFNCSLVMLNDLDIWGADWAEPGIDTTRYNIEFVNETIRDSTTTTEEGGILENFLSGVQLISRGLSLLAEGLFNSTLGFPSMLLSDPFNFPLSITVIISSIVAVVYFVGILEFVRGYSIGA